MTQKIMIQLRRIAALVLIVLMTFSLFGFLQEVRADSEENDAIKSIQMVKSVLETGNSGSQKDAEQLYADTTVRISALYKLDFSSMRLLVGTTDEQIFVDPSVIVSSYQDIYMLQFSDVKTTALAYAYYMDHADYVEVDTKVSIAGGSTEEKDEPVIMTTEENPFTELENTLPDEESYDVAVIDTGADQAAKAVSVLGEETADDNGHGNLMCQIIQDRNEDVKVLSIKALDESGTGTVSSVYAALQLALDSHVRIINLSLSAIVSADSRVIEESINEAVSKGILVVGAAGNKGANVKYFVPGKIDAALIVGACDETGTILQTSNYGDTVDYNIVAGTTSEAAAQMSAILVTLPVEQLESIADQGFVFHTNYDPSEHLADVKPLVSDSNFHSAGVLGSGGAYYLEDFFGITRKQFVDFMYAREAAYNYSYYLGTPYGISWAESDSFYPNGAPRWDGYKGMNCAGFVRCAIHDAGGSLAYVERNCDRTGYDAPWGLAGASVWFNFMANESVLWRSYETKWDLLADKWAEQGDIIYCMPTSGGDTHIGFYWGSSPGDDHMWHSYHKESLNRYGNVITEVDSKDDCIYYVFKWSPPEGWLYLNKSSSKPTAYSLAGAEYDVYGNWNYSTNTGTKVGTFITDENGKGWNKANRSQDWITLPVGTYWVIETVAPAHFVKDLEWSPALVIKSKQSTVANMEDDLEEGELEIEKITTQNNPKLIIQKSVKDDSGTPTTKKFSFSVTYYDVSTGRQTTKTFQLMNGQSKTFSCMPGTQYSVTEENDDEYAVTPSVTQTGTVSGTNLSKTFSFRATFTSPEGATTTQTFTLSNGQKKTFSELEAGTTYLIEETSSLGSAWTVSKSGETGTIEGGSKSTTTFRNSFTNSDSTISFTNTRIPVPMKALKVSASEEVSAQFHGAEYEAAHINDTDQNGRPNVTDYNKMYSKDFSGAVFLVHIDRPNTTVADKRYTTDESGTVRLDSVYRDDVITITEETPPTGYMLPEDTTVKFTVNRDGSLTTDPSDTSDAIQLTKDGDEIKVQFADMPLLDPNGISIRKVTSRKVNGQWQAMESLPVNDSVFRWDYYDNLNSDHTNDIPVRSWYFVSQYDPDTNQDGEVRYHADYLLTAEKVNQMVLSEEERSELMEYASFNEQNPLFWKLDQSGQESAALPLGSITISEVYSPPGYQLYGGVLSAAMTQDPENPNQYVITWADTGNQEVCVQSNPAELLVGDKEILMMLNKKDSKTNEDLDGSVFRITDLTDSVVLKTESFSSTQITLPVNAAYIDSVMAYSGRNAYECSENSDHRSGGTEITVTNGIQHCSYLAEINSVDRIDVTYATLSDVEAAKASSNRTLEFTIENGHYLVKEFLQRGHAYLLEEVDFPDGYVLLEDDIFFHVTEDGMIRMDPSTSKDEDGNITSYIPSSELVTLGENGNPLNNADQGVGYECLFVQLFNTPNKLTIFKADPEEETGNITDHPMVDVSFQVYVKDIPDGEWIGELEDGTKIYNNHEFQTDANGVATMYKLRRGHTYYYQEIRTHQGKKLLAEPVTVETSAETGRIIGSNNTRTDGNIEYLLNVLNWNELHLFTGGNGTVLYYLTGLLGIIGVLVAILIINRKKHSADQS